MRNVPDVAALGDPYTGGGVYDTQYGGWVQVGGTSVAAPVWAGLQSQLDAAHRALGLGAFGFLNPALYADEVNFPFFDTHDVRSGTNGVGTQGFAAGAFYDNVSGWGSMIGPQFLYAFLSNPVDSGVTPPKPITDFQAMAGKTSASFTWKASPDATGYILEEQTYQSGGNPKVITPEQIAITTGTTLTLGNLQPGSFYVFRVNAVDRGGEKFGPIAIVSTTR